MTASEELRQEAREQTTLKILLNLMDSTGWDVEKAMDVMGVFEDRDLYKRSVEYHIRTQLSTAILDSGM